MLMQVVPMNIEASMFAVITAAVTFSTDWAGDIIGGFYCQFFGVTEKNQQNFSQIMFVKILMIFASIIIGLNLLPTNEEVRALSKRLNKNQSIQN
jgi:uncharacterized membrane protein YdcZ (DUF606 family)